MFSHQIWKLTDTHFIGGLAISEALILNEKDIQMAIRKAKAGGIRKSSRKQAPVAQERPVQLADLKQALQNAVQSGPGRSKWLSHAEVASLVQQAQSSSPEIAAQFKQELGQALKNGQVGTQPLLLGQDALALVATFTGVSEGTYRDVRRTIDGAADHELAEGLQKDKSEVSHAQAVSTKNQLDDLTIQGRAGTAVSKSEFTPHHKAAKIIGAQIQNAGDAYLAENHPETKAAVDAIGPQVESMVSSTVAELSANPESMARVKNAISLIGQEGFQQAAKGAGGDIAKAFTQATGVPAMNPEVVSGLLQGLPKIAQKVAPEAAESVALHCGQVAAKLGLEAGAEAVAKTAVKEGAEAAVKAGATAAAKSVAKEGAEAAVKAGATAAAKSVAKEGAEAAVKAGATAAAKSVAKEGAEAAVKAGATAAAKSVAKEGAEATAKAGAKKLATSSGKAVPGLGNIIAIGSACLAGVKFVKSLFQTPKDGEQIAKEGLNTLLQTVGIAFPWVALGGDLVDMGWSAKKAVTDNQQGKTAQQGINRTDAAGLVATPARLLSSTLEGAGQKGTARAFSDLATATETASNTRGLEKAQLNALSQFSNMASSEVKKAAAEEENPATRDALHTVAHGFGELFKVLYQHQKLKGQDGPKRADVKGQLIRITGDVALASAALSSGQSRQEATDTDL
jgi:hypothetical protein